MNRKQQPRGRRAARSVMMLTAAVTVLTLLLFFGCNWLATALEERYALSADLSFNAMTLQSAVTEDTLKGLDRPIEMYLLTTATSDTFGDSVLLRSDLRTILERYRALSPMLTLREESLLSAPTWATRFSDMLNGQSVTTDCVIVCCPRTERAKMLTSDDFLRLQYDLDSQTFVVSAYAVEKALTEAIVYVSSDETPSVQLLTGHGELSAAETDVLEAHLAEAGYQAVRVTLHDGASLSSAQPLMILCPQFDLSAAELEWLNAYLDGGGGLIFATSYTDPAELPNFHSLLRGYGLELSQGIVVADGADKTSYYGDSPATLLPYMQATPETQELLGSGQDILLMPGVRAVTISEERDTSVYAESLLKSGSAYLREYSDGMETLDRQPSDPSGVFDLAALARRYAEDQAMGTVVVIGNAAMFTEDWIYQNTYQDAFLRAMLKALGTQQPPSLDISVKSAARSGLRLSSLSWAVWAAVLLPVLVLIAGLAVLLPRRHL